MRKPRDYDAELQALTDKAKALKMKKQSQFGELVIACRADALSIEQLAGAMLDAVQVNSPVAGDGSALVESARQHRLERSLRMN